MALPDPAESTFVDHRRTALLERGSLEGMGARSARGVAWTVTGSWVGQVLRTAALIVLARLLTPTDYGLVAEVSVLTGFLGTFAALGLSEATLQAPRLTHAQASTLFWLNTAAGALLSLVVAAAAPLVAAFYGEPALTGITVALSVSFLLSGLAVQHSALLLRQLRFRAAALRELAVVVVQIAVTLGGALVGWGYWSLVAGSLAGGVALVVAVWLAVPWRPGLPSRGADVRTMISFGGGVSTFRLLDYLATNMDNLVIGRFLGAAPLGLYSRAYNLLTLPLSRIHEPVANVVRPTMAALWTDPVRYRSYYLRALSGLCYLALPLVVVLAVLGRPVVLVMLGSEWEQSAVVFRLLAVVGVLQVVGYTNGWLYATSGRAWEWARWALVSRPVIIVSFLLGLPWGIEGVAAAYALSQCVLTPWGIARAGRGTPVSLPDVLRVVVRPAVLALGCGLGALAGLLLVDVAWQQLLLSMLTAAAAGAVVLAFAPSMRAEIAPIGALALGRLRRAPA